MVCYPDRDETAWFEIESSDPQGAAELYARGLVKRDPEALEPFAGGGALVLVRASGLFTMAINVRVEMEPRWITRRLE